MDQRTHDLLIKAHQLAAELQLTMSQIAEKTPLDTLKQAAIAIEAVLEENKIANRPSMEEELANALYDTLIYAALFNADTDEIWAPVKARAETALRKYKESKQ